MDWEFIVHHQLCGYLPVMIALVLYSLVLRLVGKKQNVGHVIVSFVFCFYLIGILTTTGVCIRGAFTPRIVLVPFVDMVRGPIDTALNILLFVPLGFFLPLLYGKFDKIGKIALAGFLISFSIEMAQMFGMGASDINDLISNTIGACLGFGFFKLVRGAIPKSWIKNIRIDGPQCFYELLFFWLGSILLMLTVQVDIYHALYPTTMGGGEMQEWK